MVEQRKKREIHVTLTMDEYVALRRCVSGELESLTQSDWDTGINDDLAAAQLRLLKGWERAAARWGQPDG